MLCFDYGWVGEMGPGRRMLRLLGNYVLTTRIPPVAPIGSMHCLLSLACAGVTHRAATILPRAQGLCPQDNCVPPGGSSGVKGEAKGGGLSDDYVGFACSQN